MITHRLLSAAALACALFATGCSTTGSSQAEPTAQRHEINAGVDGALSKLYGQVPGSRELVGKAYGVLVFPSVVSAGFVVGASYGEGALREGGHTEGYYSDAGGSVGLLAGADSRSIFVLFMTRSAYDKFIASKGWTAGVDASVTLVNVGADGSIDTQTAQPAVSSLVLNNGGLMANLSLDGTKISRLDL